MNCGKKVKQVLLFHDQLYNRGNENAKKENDIDALSRSEERRVGKEC